MLHVSIAVIFQPRITQRWFLKKKLVEFHKTWIPYLTYVILKAINRPRMLVHNHGVYYDAENIVVTIYNNPVCQ